MKLVSEIFKVMNGLSHELMNDLFRVYQKTILHTDNFTFQIEEGLCNKIWDRNTFLPWPQIIKHCSKWIYIHYWITCKFWSKNKNLDPKELSLQVMQNIYWSNRFNSSYPYDNSWISIKIQLIKNDIYPFI